MSPRRFRALALQPCWSPDDFLDEERFEAWMRGQLEAARHDLAPDRPNLVVLTEFNGLPLLLERARLASRRFTLQGALTLVMFKHLPQAALAARQHRVSLIRGLLLARAPRVAQLYLTVCSRLAEEYGVWLLSGSVPLPHFRRGPRGLEAESGEVYNTAFLFGPQGELVGSADKVYLTDLEGPAGLDLSGGRLEDLRVYATPVGDLGVATSLDAFRPEVVRHLEAAGCTVLLQPDANAGTWTATEQGTPTRRDQPQAWLDSSWKAVQESGQLRYAVNPMVVGNLFDLPFDGQSAIVARAEQAAQPRSYVMTEPRPGFLALMPWVAEGPPEMLRALGRSLAPGSEDLMENRYLSGVLYADLEVPSAAGGLPPRREHEQVLQDALLGRVRFARPRPPGVLWPLLWGVLGSALLAFALRARSHRTGLGWASLASAALAAAVMALN
nr:nitrilase-related carbon-nitrogen hydrolase [Deinobacterium chartae]